MPSVSVIVPVYNTESFLRRCVDSLLAQTYRDFEVILVDDGSPDGCGAICDRYAQKDPRVRVIHKPNGGVSSARNAGLKIAEGKYVLFCDSDDTVHPQWCEVMVQTAEEHTDAFVTCDISRPDPQHSSDESGRALKTEPECLTYFQLYKRGLSAYAWNKIFSLEKIRNGGMLFDETVFFAEDVVFTAAYCGLCSRCLLIKEKLYHYWQNESSIMHRYYSDYFGLHLPLFMARVPLMDGRELTEYCDIWFFHFSNLMKNVFDSRNREMSFWEKMRYNQRIISTEEFQFCLEHASLAYENPFLIKMLKRKNYYAYWLLEKAAEIKRRTGGVSK